jgi:hypothetical protein
MSLGIGEELPSKTAMLKQSSVLQLHRNNTVNLNILSNWEKDSLVSNIARDLMEEDFTRENQDKIFKILKASSRKAYFRDFAINTNLFFYAYNNYLFEMQKESRENLIKTTYFQLLKEYDKLSIRRSSFLDSFVSKHLSKDSLLYEKFIEELQNYKSLQLKQITLALESKRDAGEVIKKNIIMDGKNKNYLFKSILISFYSGSKKDEFNRKYLFLTRIMSSINVVLAYNHPQINNFFLKFKMRELCLQEHKRDLILLFDKIEFNEDEINKRIQTLYPVSAGMSSDELFKFRCDNAIEIHEDKQITELANKNINLQDLINENLQKTSPSFSKVLKDFRQQQISISQKMLKEDIEQEERKARKALGNNKGYRETQSQIDVLSEQLKKLREKEQEMLYKENKKLKSLYKFLKIPSENLYDTGTERTIDFSINKRSIQKINETSVKQKDTVIPHQHGPACNH